MFRTLAQRIRHYELIGVNKVLGSLSTLRLLVKCTDRGGSIHNQIKLREHNTLNK